MKNLVWILAAVVGLAAAPTLVAQRAAFTVSSPAVSGPSETGFDSGLESAGRISSRYAASDSGPPNPRSFPFRWQGLPAGTRAVALVMDDPDARLVLAASGRPGDSFLHWIAADIDPALGGLPDNASASRPSFPQGKNGRGQIGYTGPQPPAGVPKDARRPLIHVYRFTVYALSAPTGLKDGFTLAELRAAMQGKILGEATLLFSYSNG
jgi:Raf kinase inhibitor-like YbhB/YbcL family protein